MEESRRCIYCDTEKPVSDFSLEHIFPDAIGGAEFSEVFKTRHVCARCNSTSGLFIDGPFIKNFFSQNDRSEAALRYIDPNKPSALPMKYLGTLQDIALNEGHECDFWMGPHGGLVYHVRKKSNPKWDCMIGGNPIDAKKDNGTIYLFAQGDDKYWLAVLLLSCMVSFKKSRRVSGNIGLPDPPEGNEPYFDPPNAEDNKLLHIFRELNGKTHHGRIGITIGFDQRFMAKFALGFGFNLFGNDFLQDTYSNELRNTLWERDLEKRQSYGVRFYNYLSGNEDLSELFSIDGAHTILLYPHNNELILVLFVYGRKTLIIPICQDKELWRQHTDEGEVYIVAPQVNISVGPLSVSEYLAHKTGNAPNALLKELSKRKFDVKTLPPITDEC